MLPKFLIYWLILFKPGDFIQDSQLEAGVMFIQDTTMFVASPFKTTRVFVPFPEFSRIKVTQQELERHNLGQYVTQKGDGNYKGSIRSSTVLRRVTET